MMKRLLCLAGSLRNRLRGPESAKLRDMLTDVDSAEQLKCLLAGQGRQNWPQSKASGHPLSNSEAYMYTAAWAAMHAGAEVELACLVDYFGDRTLRDFSHSHLLDRIEAADGILLSGPVYFGDRSSLAHDLLQLIRNHRELVRDKVFAGVTVGAKRNGGQETCLIFQMQDFLHQGMLAVGNDSGTTSQYGGTGHAGEIGTAMDDEYGMTTSIGTGRRMAEVLDILKIGRELTLRDKPRIGILILQDAGNRCRRLVEEQILASPLAERADFKVFAFSRERVRRCLGCVVCPRTIGPDEEYRCNVQDKTDLFWRFHAELVDLDAMLVAGFSPRDQAGLSSVYQGFMERTRYIRRSDYIFSNRLVAPLVLQEVGSVENLPIRIMTSNIRHNTIMFRPVIFHLQEEKLILEDQSMSALANFTDMAAQTTAGRIVRQASAAGAPQYMPFGYTLSSQRDAEPKTIATRREVHAARAERACQEFKRRLKPVDA